MESKEIRNAFLGLLLVGAVGVFALPAGANLITNGSFEEPALAPGGSIDNTAPPGWTLTPGVWERQQNTGSENAKDGNQDVRVQTVRLWQNTGVAMVPGTTYTLTFWATAVSENQSTSYNVEGIIFAHSDDTGIGWENMRAYTQAYHAGPDFNWTQYTVQYTAVADDLGKYLLVELDNQDTYAYTRFDDVVLTPEPATMGLLAMGGVFALLRRKG
jgi:hypothetical protein